MVPICLIYLNNLNLNSLRGLLLGGGNDGLVVFSEEWEAQREQEQAKRAQEQQEQDDLMHLIRQRWNVPPAGRKVRIWFNQPALGVEEGIFRFKEDLDFLKTQHPRDNRLVFFLETDDFQLSPNGLPVFTEYIDTDIDRWEYLD